MSTRRSAQSAIAPERIPRKKKGAMATADETPTMNSESVISKTSQPRATLSIPKPTDWIVDATQRKRKSR